MRLTDIICLCLFVFEITSADLEDDNDAVIIEAAQPKERSRRQFVFRGPALPVYNPFLIPQAWSTNSLTLATTGTCITNKGIIGKCTSFRRCYPYFKFSEFNNFDSWILGMYDTCSYYTSTGRQMFGVCCTNPIKPTEVPVVVSTKPPVVEPAGEPENSTPREDSGSHSEGVDFSLYPIISNWPPPLPTHPPNNTIPPLPTHPSSPGYPTLPTFPTQTEKPSSKPPAATLPSSTTTITTTTTTKKPTQPPIGCGAKNGYQDQERIVGGHNADLNEWPWIAALFNGGRQFCGGSLIDNMHILSAAHCVAHMSSWDVARLTVKLGDHNIKTNSEVRHIEKRVKRVVRHRGFDARTLYNDISILTLDSPVEFSYQVRPVCLPVGRSDHTGKTGTVIGWGSLRESGPQPAVLQEVNIPIWDNHNCKIKYGLAAPGGIVEHMICAGQANRDSCSGDSGGPLMIKDGKWTQIGIVSWGIGCGKGQYPGVYTRVGHFLPWIYKNLK